MLNSLKSLLPCPMCGATCAKIATTDEMGAPNVCFAYTVVCDATKKGCGMTVGYQPKPDEAITAWNTRAPIAEGGSESEGFPLPNISEEDREFLCYNPNTSDILDWVRDYARQAVKMNYGDTEPHASGIPVTGVLRDAPPPSYQRQDNPAIPAFSPNYERMFMGAVEMLAEVSVALGIPDDVAECANGNAEMLEAIAELKAAATPTAAIESLSRQGGESLWCCAVGEREGVLVCQACEQASYGTTDWMPSIATVEKVRHALVRLGYATPESIEVMAIRIDQWLLTLCRELDRFMDDLPTRASEAGDWVLVPREITHEMLLAWIKADTHREGYAAMIAAAPAPGGAE